MLKAKKIGFIGGGNMAEAIIKGLLAGSVQPNLITVAEPIDARSKFLHEQYGINLSDSNLHLAKASDIIFLAVKPQISAVVMAEIAADVNDSKLILSIMAGVTTERIERAFGANIRVVRAMPNSPALVRKAATAITAGKQCKREDLDTALAIFSLLGTVVTVSENQIDAVTGLSGSGPAYVFAFIEALSDAGVANGLPRDIATALAVQTVSGAAQMVAETGEHPAILRENVTSPGGTTIAAMHVLENAGFNGVVMSAVTASCKRSKELS